MRGRAGVKWGNRGSEGRGTGVRGVAGWGQGQGRIQGCGVEAGTGDEGAGAVGEGGAAERAGRGLTFALL